MSGLAMDKLCGDTMATYFRTIEKHTFPENEEKYGGDEGDRTPDLSVANAALSQLSYIPIPGK